MNKVILYFLYYIAILLFFVACQENETYEPSSNVQQAQLVTPEDGAEIPYDGQTDRVTFQWRPGEGGNGLVVFYKVLFDRVSGDFSQPLVEKTPDALGTSLYVSLSPLDLDLLARAGEPGNESVTIKWTVQSSDGINTTMSDKSFQFILKGVDADEDNLLVSAADQMMEGLVTYFLNGMPLDIWAEHYPKRDGFWDGASTVWGHGAAFSGYTALRHMAEEHPSLQTKYKSLYEERLLTSIDQFRNRKQGRVEAYAVFPGDNDERYFDDNVWIGLDMIDLFTLTNDQRYFDRAKLVWDFVMEGSNNLVGGGVHWKEDHAAKSKNTCSTAPAAVLGLKMYQATAEQAYLHQAVEWYDWLKSTLQDPADKLYWDSARLQDPDNPGSPIEIETPKYTYNAGQPMQAAVLLYQITGNQQYLQDAKEIAEAAHNRWFDSFYSTGLDENIRMWTDDNIWFNAILLRGYIELFLEDGNAKYVNTYKKIMQHAWLSGSRDRETNLIDEKLRNTQPGPEKRILYQGGYLEMLARLATLE